MPAASRSPAGAQPREPRIARDVLRPCGRVVFPFTKILYENTNGIMRHYMYLKAI